MKNKILYCDTPLRYPGGGQVSLLVMLEHLDKEKYASLVFMPYESEFAKWLSERGISGSIVPLKCLYKKIKQAQPDIIHCNAATTRYTFFAALVAKILGIPFVWHVRVVESGGWRDKIIAGLATKIIVISDAVKEKFSWIKDGNKVVRIYNAVDADKFQAHLDVSCLKKEFAIADDYKVVGIFSRLDAWKGHRLFFDMAKIVKGKVNNIKFLVVGEGDKQYKRQLLDYVAEFGLEQDVIFSGFREDIPFLMNACDVIVNPSLEPEPFGRTIIEAMACGIPVVATDMGGPKEIIENNRDGFLVPVSAPQIAIFVEKLLQDKCLYERIVSDALQKVVDDFTVEKQMQQIEQLYDEIIL